ncbi:MAG: protein kinase [Bacteroidales bacterium]|nr:protein kinase [Candidatus Physcousia equi]
MIDLTQMMKTDALFDGRYRLIRPLSKEGGTADVWLARDTKTIDTQLEDEFPDEEMLEETGMQVAIKVYRPKNALDIEGEQVFRDEYKVVYDCRHTNLLQPTAFSICEEIPYLVMPYCQNGSSANLIGQLNEEEDMWRFVHDVASGLAYLHANNPQIVHQDIKPGNILIDNNGNFAITDFGISAKSGIYREAYTEEKSQGTLAYMGPERFEDETSRMPESDIWALGATLYELITGDAPFGDDGGEALLQGATQPQPISGISADLQRLINACLDADPTKRPTAEYIERAALAHQYPIRKKSKWPFIIIILLVLAGAGAGAFFLLKQNEELEVQLKEAKAPEVPVEQVYADALRLANTENVDSLNKGLALLDSIGRLDYIPALYEEAITYGWYKDEMSVQRKKLLGIETYHDGENDYLPTSDAVNNKAVAYLNRIIELNDRDKYADITAQALYRLACYYCNTDKVYKDDPEKALDLMQRANEVAKIAGEQDLIERTERALSVLRE